MPKVAKSPLMHARKLRKVKKFEDVQVTCDCEWIELAVRKLAEHANLVKAGHYRPTPLRLTVNSEETFYMIPIPHPTQAKCVTTQELAGQLHARINELGYTAKYDSLEGHAILVSWDKTSV